jgi:hypothetical protein
MFRRRHHAGMGPGLVSHLAADVGMSATEFQEQTETVEGVGPSTLREHLRVDTGLDADDIPAPAGSPADGSGVWSSFDTGLSD